MTNIEALVRAYSAKYFNNALDYMAVKTYHRKGRIHGFFKSNAVLATASIHINLASDASENALKETILHEMTHAYLWITNRRYKHTPLFKRMMKNLIQKEFGIIPVGNPRFVLNIDAQLANKKVAPTKEVPVAVLIPAPIPAPILKGITPTPRYKVLSNGMVGEYIKETIAWGRKMVNLKVAGLDHPFTTELSNVQRIA